MTPDLERSAYRIYSITKAPIARAFEPWCRTRSKCLFIYFGRNHVKLTEEPSARAWEPGLLGITEIHFGRNHVKSTEGQITTLQQIMTPDLERSGYRKTVECTEEDNYKLQPTIRAALGRAAYRRIEVVKESRSYNLAFINLFPGVWGVFRA